MTHNSHWRRKLFQKFLEWNSLRYILPVKLSYTIVLNEKYTTSDTAIYAALVFLDDIKFVFEKKWIQI